MWYLRFFQIINNSFIGRFVDKRVELVAHTDPDRIYVENVRSFYNWSTPVAKMFCQMAVKDNLFKSKFIVECPECDKSFVFDSRSDVPDYIECENCVLLENDKTGFLRGDCNVTEFYQLVR